MSERASWSLTGAGLIGSQVLAQLGKPQVAERLGFNPEPDYVINTKGIWEPDLTTPSHFNHLDEIKDEEFPDVNFIAIPSTNDGADAMDYLTHILGRGKIAVTAEKGAIANNYGELRAASDNFRRLGITATVGGGTKIIEAIRLQTNDDPANFTQIHAVLNGTISYIMNRIGPRHGNSVMSRGQAVDQAIHLGYAEPGSESFAAVMKGEAEGDIPKKTAIMFNHLGLGGDELLDWKQLHFELTPDDLKRVAREAKVRRFIVSIFAMKMHEIVDPKEEDIIGGFDVICGDFQVLGGFQNLDSGILPALGEVVDAGNGAVIGLGPNESDGIYPAGFGPGAGPAPTVNTMIDDSIRLRRELTAEA